MFKVTVKGIGDVKAQFIAATAAAKEVIRSEMEGMAKQWVAGAQRDAPVDQGSLKALISYYADGQMRFVIVSQAFYSPFMEFGTKGKYRPIPGTEEIAAKFKGHKGGDFMELLRMIVRWVKRKGITGTYSVKTRRRTGSKIDQFAEDYSAAWPIAISILKKGVTPHPYFFKQQDTLWPQMVKNVTARLKQQTKVSVIAPGDIRRPKIVTI